MSRRGRVSAVVAAALMVGSIGAGGVVAASRSGDEAALEPVARGGDRGVERRIDELMRRMTLDEKLNQLTLLSDGQLRDNPSEARRVGAVFSETDAATINRYQHDAVENSRLHIPILFAFDTIHGFRTVFPIPLGAASSFDPSVAETDHRIGAFESAAVGLKQIYSPMVDVSHEPRWGRISEAAGEDPYLNSVMAAARVKGAQGHDYGAPDKTVTSVKHFVAYGQPESGRDYNTTDMSEQRLRNFYLPPFKAAIDAGSDTVMCSFNAIDGVPGCANAYTEMDILKDEWGFDGFIESDYTAVAELRACPGVAPAGGPCGHGVAADGRDAAALALNAGTDSEMVSTTYRDFGRELVSSRRVSMTRIDDAVRRILRIKFRAGLFEHPYVDVAAAPGKMLLPENRKAAREAAGRSVVLLKNDGGILPMSASPSKKTALIGPLGDSAHDMLGPWWGRGDDNDAVSLLAGLREQSPNVTFTPGCTMTHNELDDPAGECATTDIASVVAAANAADQVILALGETREMSGEAEARTNLDLPGKQQDLIEAVKGTGKPFAVVLFNGRPLTLSKVDAASPAILEAWFGGVEAGRAVADVLFGKVNPGGKLPVSFPRNVGQIPIYYNHEPTGRPCDVGSRYNSRHRDIPSCAPLYEFGYGLSYTTFKLENLRLSSGSMSPRGSIMASLDVTNTGKVAGDEVAQLYIHDPVASISQPVRRLRGFERVTIQPGKKTTVSWRLDASDVGFYDNRGQFRVEPGLIEVYAGNRSSAELKQTFTVR